MSYVSIPFEYQDCALDCSVCSTDGEQYQITILEDSTDCPGRTFAETVTRDGQTLPTVNFTDVCIECSLDGQPQTCNLAIQGELLADNQVRLRISGGCDGGGRTFNEIQVVDLVLGDSCRFGPDGNPVGGL